MSDNKCNCERCTGIAIDSYCNEEEASNSRLIDGLDDVIVKMGIELVWKNQATTMKEKHRRHNIDFEIQKKIFELRQRVRKELLQAIV